MIPRATYRVQLHAGFGFAEALALVPYWSALGISHLYCSPLLRARPGSQHGYDVVEHRQLNPELGTREDFDRLVAALHAEGMGLVVDIVPNHMGVLGGDNAWWLDVLENGPASAYAEHFDIDWAAADRALAGKVLLPILGDQYGVVLERGELQLAFDAGRGYFTIDYHEHRLPLDPAGYGALLRRVLREGGLGAGLAPAVEALATAFDGLPPRDTTDPAARHRRQRAKTVLKARLAGLAREAPALTEALQALARRLNGRVGRPASFDPLHALIDAQPYRLAHWRVAGDEINYRRFFDVNELAALRMERPEVFEATHALVLELAAAGAIDGLRIDHPDGLADPAAYFERLQRRYAEPARLSPSPRAEAGGERPALPLYVVVEKIVAAHEQLPREWAVHGTTGYRFANVVNALLVDAGAKARLDRTWRLFVREEAEDFDTLAWHCRVLVMEGALSGELTVLATALLRLARADRRTRDFTLNSLRQALAEVVAAFPVYRTYVGSDVDAAPSVQDRRFIDWAVGLARRRHVVADASIFDFIRRVLLARHGGAAGMPSGRVAACRAFAQRLQQYTAPVAAKGIEDTALYRHHRLVSLNDVGGDPEMFGFSVPAFHGASRDRDLNWPHTMLATSTHDAKRSEDLRARLDVISEMPAAWRLATRRWSRLNRRLRRTVDGEPAPTRSDEYLLYQLLVGSLPAGALDEAGLAAWAQRVEASMLKAARESKRITSWMRPHEAYEAALTAFVRALLGRLAPNPFLDDLRANAEVLAWFGALNGLTVALLRCLSPGVPDLYQGHELIELSMADPDNRRAVDFERRRRVLAELQGIAARPERAAALRELLRHATDGRAKFWVTWRALDLKRRHEVMLRRARYVPLEVHGERAAHVVAFARCTNNAWLVVVATRLAATLHGHAGELPRAEHWGDTAIVWPAEARRPASLADHIGGGRFGTTGRTLAVADVLQEWPVAALFGTLPVVDDERTEESFESAGAGSVAHAAAGPAAGRPGDDTVRG
ncbi:MAG: malto-oligosyltrehalose synthase [Rubrivivax sp.]|nr:malto-oligosyltrehalose synthase [Rubrivivax sp.]